MNLKHDRFTKNEYRFVQVAQEDQKTFTDLVRQLVGRCGSDIEKARYLNVLIEYLIIIE